MFSLLRRKLLTHIGYFSGDIIYCNTLNCDNEFSYPIIVAGYMIVGFWTPVLLAIVPGAGGEWRQEEDHHADEPHSFKKHC